MLESFNAARVRRTHARRARRERMQLQADLASYTSDADRYDLEATLDRYPAAETVEIRRILAQQAVS